ncbi:MAG: LuxR C-terminal-related transcriptional regulator [Rubrivivax sp.]|nr:LuxR C-terminal-related transcriptional regulator [Rubrivivax sp.]
MSQLESVVVALLDELDYGVILLREAVHVVHLNHAARGELRSGHRVEVTDGVLRAHRAGDAAALGEAMAAAHRGLRRFITLGADDERLGVALIPIGTPGAANAGLTMAVFGRQRLCERISVQWFARAHGLTPAECTVLELLCEGLDPREIARANEVGMATVRTQVTSIRSKVGADSIRGLLHKVAMLPPMVSSLRC